MLTPKQQVVYRFIRHYILNHDYAPTEREIAEAVGLRSRGVVHRHLKALEREKLIRREPRKRRNIELLDYIQCLQLPIVGRIAAGKPIEKLEKSEVLNLADLMVGENRFVLQVKGNSMSGDQICDGDYIICDKRENVEDGEIAVVLIKESETTLKRVKINNDATVSLLSSNPIVEPMVYPLSDIKIQGVYLGLIRLNA